MPLGRMAVHLDAFIFIKSASLGQNSSIDAHFSNVMQLGTKLDGIAEIACQAQFARDVMAVFVNQHNVIAGASS